MRRQMTASAERIVVTVTETGGYRVNERELVNSSRETLQAAVLAVSGKERSERVVLRADARATPPGSGHGHGRAGQDGIPATGRGHHPAACGSMKDRSAKDGSAKGRPVTGGRNGHLPAAACLRLAASEHVPAGHPGHGDVRPHGCLVRAVHQVFHPRYLRDAGSARDVDGSLPRCWSCSSCAA